MEVMSIRTYDGPRAQHTGRNRIGLRETPETIRGSGRMCHAPRDAILTA
jgi:hypothetical protein